MNSDSQIKKFFTGGFLFNPKTNEVLLHKRDMKTEINPGQWGFFGGLSEDNETPKQCCIREWKEELGITVDEKDLIPFCDYLNSERNTWRYVFFMESELKKSDMILGEGEDFDWIPLSKVFEYNLTDKTRVDLRKFIASRK